MDTRNYGEWICSDADSVQYGRKLRELAYEFYQITHVKEDDYAVIHGKVYLDDKDVNSVRFQKDYLAPYSYNSIADLKLEYREAWARVAAECVFETDFLDYIVVCGSKDFCKGYVTAKVEE